MASPAIIAYTDGGCRGNPGPGAWAFVVIDQRTQKGLFRTDGENPTTNNRMEILGAVRCLQALRNPGTAIEIRSDSQYLIHAATQWMAGWKRNGWKRKQGALKNVELFQELDQLLGLHQVTWQWVKGHAGDAGNEFVDDMLNQAMDRMQAGKAATDEARLSWPPQ
jgi:ribonuclease HI